MRGFKYKDKPLRNISIGLIKRAGMLYAWGIGLTIAILALTGSYGEGSTLLPDMPSPEQLTSPLTLLWAIISTDYFSPWIYFLRLYAIMLLATPLFLWLIRRKLYYIIIILMAGAYTLSYYVYEAALEWQILFFSAALIGYHLDSFTIWFNRHPKMKVATAAALLTATVITIITSYFFTHGWNKVEDPNWHIMDYDTYIQTREAIAPYVSADPLALPRIILSYIWFGGLLVLFKLIGRWLLRFGGWLLIPLGQRSLSAYCLQAIILPIIAIVITPSEHQQWRNAVISLSVVLLIWGLLKMKLIQKIIPQ